MVDQVITDENEFADAFATLTAAENTPPSEPAPADPAEPAPAPAEPTPAPAEPAPAEPAPAPTEPAPAEPIPAADPMAELEAARRELASLKATPAPAPAPQAPAPQAAPVEPAPVYSAEETATLAKYEEDWPDIRKGEALIRKAEYRELVGYIFDQIHRQYSPLQEHFNTSSVRTQYSDIVSLVPDYDTVRDKTLAWIDTQPDYLKTAYQAVASSGTPQDVADLIGRYKKEAGIANTQTPAVQSDAVPPAAPAAPGLTPAAKKAAASLSVVKSSRGEQTAGADPNDFDNAFKEFATQK